MFPTQRRYLKVRVCGARAARDRLESLKADQVESMVCLSQTITFDFLSPPLLREARPMSREFNALGLKSIRAMPAPEEPPIEVVSQFLMIFIFNFSFHALESHQTPWVFL